MEGEKEGRSMWTPEKCEERQNRFVKKTEKFKCRFPSVAFFFSLGGEDPNEQISTVQKPGVILHLVVRMRHRRILLQQWKKESVNAEVL